jgi:Novel STAND NTPase 1/Sulfatase-modifying factor enzyme 1/Effector-associated domain 1
MRLTGPQFNQIQEALLDAYDEAGLRQIVRAGLDKDLPQIAGGGNVTEIAYNLVAWADRQNRVQELIEAAVAGNPTNPMLQGLQQDTQRWHLAPPAGEKEPEPYKGLDFFDVGDADLFFGRDRLTAELVAYLCDHQFLAVVGASGSGKSSLVRAGVVPALQRGKHLTEEDRRPTGSERWPVYIMVPTAHPLESLAIELVPRGERKIVITELMDDMAQDPRSLHLHLRQLLKQDKITDRLLLVVDQFEELFTLCRDRDERQAFVDNLLTAAAPNGVTTVVLTLRADFYAHCADHENLWRALQTSQHNLLPMSEAELRQAIETPAAQGNWVLEEGLVDLMLGDVVREPGALPLLSHALLETWNRRSGRMLTLAGYQASGRVLGAIAKTAENTLDRMTDEQRGIARKVFLNLTELGEETPDTRRRVALRELVPEGDGEPEERTVLNLLADARLVTTHRETVEVAHEALIRRWPTLQGWLDEERESLRTERYLRNAVAEWTRSDRNFGLLYRGVRLEQASAWAAHGGKLGEREREFLAASQANEVLGGNWHETAAAIEELRQQDAAQQQAMKRVWITVLSNPERRVLERARAGDALGLLGDPRPGVGLRPDDLPDITWLEVKAEPFLMGAGAEQFTCNVITESFHISRYPITVAQYQVFVEAGGYEQKQYWTVAGWRTRDTITAPRTYQDVYQIPNHPQVGVSWYEAVAFCNWLSRQTGKVISLPSEAQWELAARGTDGQTYPWGDQGAPATHCNMYDTGIGVTPCAPS